MKEENESQAKSNAKNKQYINLNKNNKSQSFSQDFGRTYNFKGQTTGIYQNTGPKQKKDYEKEGFSNGNPDFFKTKRPEYIYKPISNWLQWINIDYLFV